MSRGEIKNIITEKGFGFITPEGADRNDKNVKSVFFHLSGLSGGLRIESLKPGDIVEYDLKTDGPKGPSAINVKLADAADEAGEANDAGMESDDSEDMQEAA